MLYNGRIVWVLNVSNYTFSHLWVNFFFTLNKQKSEQKIIKPKPKIIKVTLKKSHKQFFSLKLSKSKNSFDLAHFSRTYKLTISLFRCISELLVIEPKYNFTFIIFHNSWIK
jgi:hypothetical protein